MWLCVDCGYIAGRPSVAGWRSSEEVPTVLLDVRRVPAVSRPHRRRSLISRTLPPLPLPLPLPPPLGPRRRWPPAMTRRRRRWAARPVTRPPPRQVRPPPSSTSALRPSPPTRSRTAPAASTASFIVPTRTDLPTRHFALSAWTPPAGYAFMH